MEEKERVEKNVIMKERERKIEKHRPFFFFFLSLEISIKCIK